MRKAQPEVDAMTSTVWIFEGSAFARRMGSRPNCLFGLIQCGQPRAGDRPRVNDLPKMTIQSPRHR